MVKQIRGEVKLSELLQALNEQLGELAHEKIGVVKESIRFANIQFCELGNLTRTQTVYHEADSLDSNRITGQVKTLDWTSGLVCHKQ